MAVTQSRRWTPDEVRALPDDGNRYECVAGGLLVNPAPSLAHQRLLSALTQALGNYLSREHAGEVLFAPIDVQPDDFTLVQPDLLVIRFDAGRPVASVTLPGSLLLVCEVISPSSRRHDRFTKRAVYQAMGVECWIFDIDQRSVERWMPGALRAEVLTTSVHWQPGGATAALTLDLPPLFARAAGDKPPR